MKIKSTKYYYRPQLYALVFLMAIIHFNRGCDSDSQKLQTKTQRDQIEQLSKKPS
jgi:hypothetical protein